MKPAVFIVIVVAFIAGATTGILYEKMEKGLIQQDTLKVVETKFEKIYLKAKTRVIREPLKDSCVCDSAVSDSLYQDSDITEVNPQDSSYNFLLGLEATADTTLIRNIVWNGKIISLTDSIKLSYSYPENKFGLNLLKNLVTEQTTESSFWQTLAMYGLSSLLGALAVIAIQTL